MKNWQRVISVALVCLAFLTLSSTLGASPASAAAYTKDVYAPERDGDKLTADADLNRDCSDTYGCWNYMKIERHRAWGQEYVDGRWANKDGWNTISATLPGGCYNYRTVVDSYNDVLAERGVGMNVGVVGITASGQKIYRFKRTWSSGEARICK